MEDKVVFVRGWIEWDEALGDDGDVPIPKGLPRDISLTVTVDKDNEIYDVVDQDLF